ncbi:MAG: tagaturonate epimerase family protein [Candidatus Methylomirabilales bacterium]
MILSKYSMGIGDRFARQGVPQLTALVQAKALGVDVVPVWNKSNREHLIVHTHPDSVRVEADTAVKALGWKGPYHVDADHIGLKTVDAFMAASDFFTLDVADFTGQAAPEAEIQDFVARHRRYAATLKIPGIDGTLHISERDIADIARKYLLAVKEAGAIYRHVEAAKGRDRFITEVSIDETDKPQTPIELFFILAAVADQKIPAQTIAPKFTGRFNKGVDYVGDVAQFEKEFNEDLAVIAFAIREFGLPANLKLSVHSGSDKFSIYGPIARALRKHNAGLHLKTAGTTWLEEVAGLATAGGDTLKLAQEVYEKAYARIDDLCKPYAAVIDIDRAKLPDPKGVRGWSASEFAATLRHDQKNPAYNRHFRQLIHVGFKVAAEMGDTYYQALEANAKVIGRLVTENLLEKHIKPVFVQG